MPPAQAFGSILFVDLKVDRGTDQPKMRECLREIAEERMRAGVNLFGEQPDMVGAITQVVE